MRQKNPQWSFESIKPRPKKEKYPKETQNDFFLHIFRTERPDICFDQNVIHNNFKCKTVKKTFDWYYVNIYWMIIWNLFFLFCIRQINQDEGQD